MHAGRKLARSGRWVLGLATMYVALGDSISIDEYAGGPGRGGASLLARNRDDDFPDWAGRDLATRRPDWPFHLLATDGATSTSVLDRQLPRLAALDSAPDLVTLTIGGNDLLMAYGESRLARDVIAHVVANVDRIVTAVLGAMAADGALVLGTVYDPSDGTGDAERVGLPPWPEAVELIGELNRSLTDVARRHGLPVADIHARFLGHGVDAGHPGQHAARPKSRELWYCNVIEPNAWGASEVRGAFWDALEGIGRI